MERAWDILGEGKKVLCYSRGKGLKEKGRLG